MNSIVYKGAHDISFWDPNSGSNEPKLLWDDFHLIPKTRPFITLYSVNTKNDQIPKSSIYIDTTNHLPGGKTYNERSGVWNFIIDHSKWKEWLSSYKSIRDYFNGKRLYVSLNDDPLNIYVGRFAVSDYTVDKEYSSVSIAYNLDYILLTDDAKSTLKYRIRYLDEYGNVLQSTLYNYGSIPIYERAVKSFDGYRITGYSESPKIVHGNHDYIVYRIYVGFAHSIRFVDLTNDIETIEPIPPKNIEFGSIRS